MENLLTDLCVESEAHTLTAMYLASTYDASLYGYTNSPGCNSEELFRIGVAVEKYWVTKRYPNFAYECMEVEYSYSDLTIR